MEYTEKIIKTKTIHFLFLSYHQLLELKNK